MEFYGIALKRNRKEMPQDIPKLRPSFLRGKCPRCRTGNVFEYPLTRFDQFSKTHSNCPHCNLKFEAEPGFYWGAMYVSFGFSTALLLLTAILSTTNEWSLTTTLLFVLFTTLICIPFMFRYSRLIMLYFLSPATHRFNPKYMAQKKGE